MERKQGLHQSRREDPKSLHRRVSRNSCSGPSGERRRRARQGTIPDRSGSQSRLSRRRRRLGQSALQDLSRARQPELWSDPSRRAICARRNPPPPASAQARLRETLPETLPETLQRKLPSRPPVDPHVRNARACLGVGGSDKEAAWAVSSAGRAPALHAGCRRFESVTAHQPSRLRRFGWQAEGPQALSSASPSTHVSGANADNFTWNT